MDNDQKLDDMHGMLHEMRPMLAEVRDTQKAMDSRLRIVEVVAVEHKVKIDRIQSDLDGLGRKVRARPTGADAAGRGEPRGGKWLAFLEFLAVVPQYWHVIFSLGSLVTTAAVILYRHWPRG